MVEKHSFRYDLLIVLAAVYFFIPFLGSVHLFDWDEINFAESAREMIVSGNYSRVQIDFTPFWEKPPLFFWLQVLSMKLFGINEFAARFPNAVCGIATLLLIYRAGTKLFSLRLGLLWALAYTGSLLPHLYFKSGIIDPVFNLFIFSGIYFISFAVTENNASHRFYKYLWAGFFIGLAVLTKGPVGLLIPLLCVLAYWSMVRFAPIVNVKEFFFFAIVVAMISFAWYGIETIKNGPWFLKEFIAYQFELFSQPVAGHAQPFYYHFVILLLGCFPASAFAAQAFTTKIAETNERANFIRWMKILFWVVLILFSVVKTKIVHYSSLCYFPLTFLAAYILDGLLTKKIALRKGASILLVTIGVTIALLFTLLPLLPVFREKIIPFIRDPFAVENLRLSVTWSGYEFLIGLAYLLLLCVSFSFLFRQKYMPAIVLIFLSTAFFLQIFTAVVVPKIEQYSQGTAVRFFESLKKEDCYIRTLGYKSYANYFYAAVRPPKTSRRYDTEWLLKGDIDKPAYFVCKITYAEEVRKYPELQELKSEGGFVFFKRPVPAAGDSALNGWFDMRVSQSFKK